VHQRRLRRFFMNLNGSVANASASCGAGHAVKRWTRSGSLEDGESAGS